VSEGTKHVSSSRNDKEHEFQRVRITKLNPEISSYTPTIKISAKQLLIEPTLLLDTGADPNLIKAYNLKLNTAILREDTLYLSGIGIDYTKTLGSIEISFMSHQVKFQLNVVPDTFEIREERILRNNFLDKYSAIINYKTGQVEYNGSKIQIKIRDSIVIPARSISTSYAKMSNPEIKTVLISRLHLGEDIYGEDVLATNRNGIAYIKITNTRETDKTVMISSVKLEDYEILGNSIDELESHNSKKESFNKINTMTTKEIHNNRGKIIRDSLRLNHLNTEEANHINEIIDNYNDLFRLPNGSRRAIAFYRRYHTQNHYYGQQVDT